MAIYKNAAEEVWKKYCALQYRYCLTQDNVELNDAVAFTQGVLLEQKVVDEIELGLAGLDNSYSTREEKNKITNSGK